MRLLKYIKKPMDIVITFQKGDCIIAGYVDASWASTEDLKSISTFGFRGEAVQLTHNCTTIS